MQDLIKGISSELTAMLDIAIHSTMGQMVVTLAFFFVIYKGIPYYIAYRRGDKEREKAEKESTRDSINALVKTVDEKVLPALTSIKDNVDINTKRLAEINGGVQKHHANTDIHMTREKIINDSQLMERQATITTRLDTRDIEVREMMANIYNRINTLAEAKGV